MVDATTPAPGASRTPRPDSVREESKVRDRPEPSPWSVTSRVEPQGETGQRWVQFTFVRNGFEAPPRYFTDPTSERSDAWMR